MGHSNKLFTFEVDAAFLSGEPFVADARHLVGGRFEDAASVAVTFLAVLAFGCKSKRYDEKMRNECCSVGYNPYPDKCVQSHQPSRRIRIGTGSGRFLSR